MPYYRYSALYAPYLYRYYRDPTRNFGSDQTPSFEFLESIVVGIDREGNITWDNSLVVDNADSESLMNLVDAFASREYIHMLYKLEDELVHKSIPFTSAPVEEFVMEVELDEADEDIRSQLDDVGGSKGWKGRKECVMLSSLIKLYFDFLYFFAVHLLIMVNDTA